MSKRKGRCDFSSRKKFFQCVPISSFEIVSGSFLSCIVKYKASVSIYFTVYTQHQKTFTKSGYFYASQISFNYQSYNTTMTDMEGTHTYLFSQKKRTRLLAVFVKSVSCWLLLLNLPQYKQWACYNPSCIEWSASNRKMQFNYGLYNQNIPISYI